MKILLHFGFPKTMSSSLQFGLFKPLHENGLVNLKTWRQNDSDETLDSRPSSRLFNNLSILDSYLDFKENALNILSDESFTAPLKLRKNNYGNDIIDPIMFPAEIKKQIISKYGNNIEFVPLVVIRNQADLIYSQYVEEYNLKKYKNIDLLFNDKGIIDLAGFEIYNFYKYISNLESVFGEGKSNVFLFEDWIENFDFCCHRLAHIMDIEFSVVRDSLLNTHINKKKKSSKGYYTKDGSELIPFLNYNQKLQIKSFFNEDNLKLQDFLGIHTETIKQKYISNA